MGIWGGTSFAKKLFGIDKVPFGYMMIYEQTAKDSIVDEDDNVLARLPFSIYLEDFRIEYYKSRSYLQVENKDGNRKGGRVDYIRSFQTVGEVGNITIG